MKKNKKLNLDKVSGGFSKLPEKVLPKNKFDDKNFTTTFENYIRNSSKESN